MRFKRLMSASLAGIMAVSSSIVCQISASAEAVNKPEGTETVLGTLTTENETTHLAQYASCWYQIYGLDKAIFENSNVYVKIAFKFDTAPVFNAAGNTMADFASWGWDSYSSWLHAGKFYDGTVTSGTTGVNFVPSTSSTGTEWYSYLPISDFTVGDHISGNVQTNYADTTITSVELVEFSAVTAPELPENKYDFDTPSGTVAADSWGQPASTAVGDDQTITAEVLSGDFIITVPYTGNATPQVVLSVGDESSALNWIKVNSDCVVDGIAYFLKKDLSDAWTTAGGKSDFSELKKIYVTASSADELTVENVALYSSVKKAESYKITIAESEHGKVTCVSDASKAGEEIELTVTPDEGYELDTLAVTGADGTAVTVTGNKFTMPAQDVTVTATFKKTDKTVIAEAKAAADKAVAGITATNQTTAKNILDTVIKAVNNETVTVQWKADPVITAATEEKEGSIVGTITLTKGTETAEVAVNLTIAKLPVDDASRVAAAKAATENVLKGITATNDITEKEILDKINAAIADTKATATISNFKVEKATSSAAGKVTGTVTLTSGEVSDTVAIDLTIAQLEKTDEEKLAEAKAAAQAVVDKAEKAEDITKEAIEAAVNNKEVTVAVESKVTKEPTTAEEGETTVTVTLTVGKASDTITKKFAIAKLPEEEKPAEEVVLWEGSQELPAGWGTSIQIDKDVSHYGDGTIVVEVEPGVGAQMALKYSADGWPVVPGLKDYYDVADKIMKFEVKETAFKTIGSNKLIVGGQNLTVKKVSYIPVASYDEEVTIKPSTSTKVENVVVKTDASGNIVEELAYFAISAEDAKKYDSYTVTIERAKDGKKFVVVITDCYEEVAYENGGKNILVKSEGGAYCVLLDIVNIGVDFGELTITIAPNA